MEDFKAYSEELYRQLDDKDLSYKALETALKGFVNLQLEKKIEKVDYLTVIDMSMSANQNRFFLIDLNEKRIAHKSVVAHGRNSGGEYARSFSNQAGSFKSSIGFYKTAETYQGKHGLSLRLDGLEYSNADYVSQSFIKNNGRLGRSLGCPSLPKKNYEKIVEKIRGGSLLFIYYPEKTYLSRSVLVNHHFGTQNSGQEPVASR